MQDSRFALKDTLRCSALALALFLIVAFIPMLSILVCLIPSFMAVATYRNSLKMGILGTMIVVTGVAFIAGIGGMVTAVEFCVMGLIIGELMRRKVQQAYVMVIGAIVFVGMTIGLLFLSGEVSLQVALDNILKEYRQAIVSGGMQMLEPLGGETYLDTMITTIKSIFPSLLVCFGIFTTFVNYFLAGNMLMKMYLKRQVPMLAEFTLPGNIAVGVVTIMLLTLFANIAGFKYGEALYLNISIVLSTLFYLQGFSVLYHFSMTRMKPITRNIFIAITVIFVPMYTIIQFIGFFDAAFNIRKLDR